MKITTIQQLEEAINTISTFSPFADILHTWFETVQQLNTKYNDFPLFNLRITVADEYGHMPSNVYEEDDYDKDDRNAVPLKYDLYKKVDYFDDDNKYGVEISLNFNNFALYKKLYKSNDPNKLLNDTTYTFSYNKLYYYRYSIQNSVWSLNMQRVNLLDHYTYLKQQESNPKFVYLKTHSVNEYFHISYVTKKPTKDETFLADLLKADLYQVIFVELDLLQDDILKNSPYFISTYTTNTLSHLSRLQANTKTVTSPNPWTYFTFIVLHDGLNYFRTNKIDYDNDIVGNFIARIKDTTHIMFLHMVYINTLFRLNNLTYINGTTSKNESHVLRDFKTSQDEELNNLKTYQQVLDTNVYLHGTDQAYFLEKHSLNTITTDYDNKVNYADQQHLFFGLVREPAKDGNSEKKDLVLKQPAAVINTTINYYDYSKQNVFHTTINPNEMFYLMQKLYQTLNLNNLQIHTQTYNERIAMDNKNTLAQALLKNLPDLAHIFPTKTIYTKPILTFSQNQTLPNYPISQMFLTLNPLLNPYNNHHKFAKVTIENGDKYGAIRHANIPLAQEVNYVQLSTRTSLTKIFLVFFHHFSNWNDFVCNYFYFIQFLSAFFRHFVLFSTKYGYLTCSIGVDNLLYSEIYLPNYETNKQAITDLDLSAANNFYDTFLTCFFDECINNNFFSLIEAISNEFPSSLQNIWDKIKDTSKKVPGNNKTQFDAKRQKILSTTDLVTQEKLIAELMYLWYDKGSSFYSRLHDLQNAINKFMPNDFKNKSYLKPISEFIQNVITKFNTLNPQNPLSLKTQNQYIKDLTTLQETKPQENITLKTLDTIQTYKNNKKNRL